MDNNTQLKELIEVFKEYRDLITPLQENMQELAKSFSTLKSDVEKLNSAFEGGLSSKLNEIADTVGKQAKRGDELASTVDRFTKESSKYFGAVSSAVTILEKTEQKIKEVDEIENRAREQIKRLDTIIEDKRINYNIRDLQKALEGYNVNVKRMSDFINKDVAEALSKNASEIEQIKRENENVSKKLDAEGVALNELLEIFRSSNGLLNSVVEKQDVNEAYVFDILDKWAVSRKIKITK